MRSRRRPPPWILLAFAPFLASVVFPPVAGFTLMPEWYGLVVLAGALLGIFAITVAYHRVHAADRAALHALVSWGADHGLAHRASAEPAEGSCLLLDRDDAIVVAVRGTTAGERKGWVAHVGLPVRRYKALYVIPLIGPIADQRIDDWTLVQVGLRAAEVRPLGRVVLSRRDALDRPPLRALRDAATSLRSVELESIALGERYALLVDDEADDVHVRTVFTPALIVFLVERAGDALLVELRRQTLTVAVPGRAVERADLERVLDEARLVAEAFAPAIADEEALVQRVRVPEPPRTSRWGIAVTVLVLVATFTWAAILLVTQR